MRISINNDKFIKVIIIFLITLQSIIISWYYTNIVKGFIDGVFNSIFLIPIFLFILFCIKVLIKKRYRRIIANYVVTVFLMLIVIIFNKYSWDPPPELLFKRVFKMEVPISVTNIKSYSEYPGSDQIFRLRFNIKTKDLENILVHFTPYEEGNRDVTNYKSKRSKYAQLNVLYLLLCNDVSWWDFDSISPFPMYKWRDNRYYRTLWFKKNNTVESTVFVAGMTH